MRVPPLPWLPVRHAWMMTLPFSQSWPSPVPCGPTEYGAVDPGDWACFGLTPLTQVASTFPRPSGQKLYGTVPASRIAQLLLLYGTVNNALDVQLVGGTWSGDRLAERSTAVSMRLSPSCETAWAASPTPSKPRTSGRPSGTRRPTTRPPSRATPWS